METLLIFLFIALFFSFLCSILEAVLLSITPSYIAVMKEKGSRTARQIQAFKDDIDRPLAAILTLNTFAHTLGAAGVGAQAQRLWGDEYLSAVSAVLTIVILVFSEIIPKTIGAIYWKRLAPPSIWVIKLIIYSPLYPFVLLSRVITGLISRDRQRSVLSRLDFSALASAGEEEGVLKQHESQIISNIIGLDSITVRQIMTPATVTMYEDCEATFREFMNKHEKLYFSRIPVYEDNPDNITGYVLKDEILQNIINGRGDERLKTIQRPIAVVHEGQGLGDVFNLVMEKREQIALVVNEFGGFSGIVTLEDLIETIIGEEIVDEQDHIADMQMLARKLWRVRAKKAPPAGAGEE